MDRIDQFPAWAFLGTLYVARWVVVVPIGYLIQEIGLPNSGGAFTGSPLVLLFGFLVLAPLLETLIECALPYWLAAKWRGSKLECRAWRFVMVAASLMALLHLDHWPGALLPSLVTGGFLGYNYAHFARTGTGSAILYTALFHAAINLVGWLLLFVVR